MKEQEAHNEDEKTLQQWARVADCRRHASTPDVDAEWQRFRDRHIVIDSTNDKPKHHTIKVWMAALAGAAAMLVAVLIYTHVARAGWGEMEADKGVIVMRQSEGPQKVALTLGNRIVDVSHMDSLNLYENDMLIDGEPYVSNHPMESLSTPRGMDFKLVLQDGTEVWLNAESTIEFPSSFVSSDQRYVKLKGEAYFKVAHDEKKPFVVTLGDKEIRVLGTEFDARNYDAEMPMVALVKGSIELCSNGVCQLIKPGQSATWGEGESPQIQDIDTYNVTQWVEGLFYYDEQTLVEMLVDVARWYNVGVRFANRQHSKHKVHFSASRTDELSQILEDLQTVCGFNIALEGREIVVY